ncbi:hypothetical protein M407DRAFT_246603 [Tulasnella calospora MUT 4182]|uniref:Uncharacterized protein n=1 Tax=Tulasnella calospora MUT 4182 TaxID=1051891 RepID=A0A0C3L931_9AGAM|nr:hypothetical protein M407DRAFT_246603 [Tulasnella calospora MUT 4182]
MSPISKAFAKSSRNGEVEARPTKRGWNDRSWVMGPEWRPSSSNTPTPPKTMAFDSKW